MSEQQPPQFEPPRPPGPPPPQQYQPPPYWPPPPGYQAPPPGYHAPAYGAQQWHPPPQIDGSLLRPRTGWFVLSALVFAASLIVAAALGWAAIKQFFEPVERFTTSAPAELSLAAGEERSIYLQTRGDGASDDISSDPVCRIAGARTRQVASTSAKVATVTLDRGSRRYLGKLNFEVPAADRYRVSCRVPGEEGRAVPLAVGPRLSLREFGGPLLSAVGAFFGGLILAAAIAIPVLVMRSRHRRRLEQEAHARG